MLDQAKRVVWKRTAIIDQQDDRLVVRRIGKEYVFRGAAAKLLQRVVPELDGETTLAAVAERLGLSAPVLTQLASRLAELELVGVLGGAGERLGMSGPEFYQLHKRYCREWLEPIYVHPLWASMAEGRASREQVLGFGFEKYHYIEAAHEHMSIAVANARPELMPHLARHFIEEYTHGDIYRAGLRAYFSNEVILASQAIPSTRALINFLNESAQRDSFSYYAGNELLQATENTSEDSEANGIEAFYQGMLRHYPWSARLVRAFKDHTALDQKLGHEDVFKQICDAMPALTADQVDDALRTTKLMAEHLMLFMDGIERYYEWRPALPRVPMQLASI